MCEHAHRQEAGRLCAGTCAQQARHPDKARSQLLMEVGSGRNGAESRNLALSDTYLVFIKNVVIEGLLWCPPRGWQSTFQCRGCGFDPWWRN